MGEFTHIITKTDIEQDTPTIYFVCSSQPKMELKGNPKVCPFCREVNPLKIKET